MTSNQTSALDIEEIMSKPEGSKCVYPSDELIRSWWNGPQIRGCTAVETVARKAADWQREQDALICEQYAEANKAYSGTRLLLQDCASAIRAPKSQEGEHE